MRFVRKIKRSILMRGTLETILIIIYDLIFSLKFNIKIKESTPLELLNIDSGNKIHAIPYQGCSYYYFKMAFRNLPLDITRSSMIDFGSGKGNVLLMAYNLGIKKVLGVEFAKELVEEGNKRIIKKLGKNYNSKIKIIHRDAVNFEIPTDYNVFFFYNPFDSVVFEKVLFNIDRSLEIKKRKIFLIYINVMVNIELFAKFNYNLIFNHSNEEKSEVLILSKT
jgi:hypothetical protein